MSFYSVQFLQKRKHTFTSHDLSGHQLGVDGEHVSSARHNLRLHLAELQPHGHLDVHVERQRRKPLAVASARAPFAVPTKPAGNEHRPRTIGQNHALYDRPCVRAEALRTSEMPDTAWDTTE